MSDHYPLHRLVWKNDVQALRVCLEGEVHDLEERDPRGRTPLRLAVALQHTECVKVLLECGADAAGQDKQGWTAVHDATCTGQPALLQAILENRAYAMQAQADDSVPQLLAALEQTPDFSVAMDWRFSSWIPFVSRMCPSDTCHIWKKGNTIRFDMTLLDFQDMAWVRGHRSIIYSIAPQDDSGSSIGVTVRLIDHDNRSVMVETTTSTTAAAAGGCSPYELQMRMDRPVTTTTLDEDEVSFERLKSGVWGFQRNRVEDVEGYECQVYGASGIELVTKTRVEHLPRDHPARKKSQNPVARLLRGGAGGDEAGCFDVIPSAAAQGAEDEEENDVIETANGTVTLDEYLSPPRSRQDVLIIGRPREIKSKTQSIKLTLWMCDSFPLSLKDQILPIMDLLAPMNKHIGKLRDFVALQLPAGFPVKISAPVYPTVNAQVTFQGFEEGCPDADGTLFQVPQGYREIRAEEDMSADERMLAMAMQASLQGHDAQDDYMFEADLQRAIAASMGDVGMTSQPVARGMTEDEMLQQALANSLLDTQGSGGPQVQSSVTPRVTERDLSQLSEEEQLRIMLERSMTDM